MPRSVKAVFGLLFAFIVVALLMLAFTTRPVAAPAMASSSVKIELSDGHGSGVHVGNGYILTAAHVAVHAIKNDAGRSVVQVKTSDGGMQWGEVYLINTSYDVALIRIWTFQGIKAAPLSLKPATIGEAIHAEGAPKIAEWFNSWGHVASTEQKIGDWPRAVFTDLSIAPGSSGGPAYDEDGNLVGLTVGGMPGTIITVLIPVSVIRELMPNL